jgi:hypothetical protein
MTRQRLQQHTEMTERKESWIAVDMDGRVIHGPGTYEAVRAAVEREGRRFRRSRYATGGAYLPRSIVRADLPRHRVGQFSTAWTNWTN